MKTVTHKKSKPLTDRPQIWSYFSRVLDIFSVEVKKRQRFDLKKSKTKIKNKNNKIINQRK